MTGEAEPPRVWEVAGSYFEACNCEAICPCRKVGRPARSGHRQLLPTERVTSVRGLAYQR